MSIHDALDIITGEHKKKQRKRFASSFLIASSVGFVAAILTAPQSGAATRQDISDSTISTRLRVERSAARTINKIKENKDNLSDNMKDLGSDVKQSVGAIQTTVSEIQDLLTTLSRTVRYFEREKSDPEETTSRLKEANEKLHRDSKALKQALDAE